MKRSRTTLSRVERTSDLSDDMPVQLELDLQLATDRTEELPALSQFERWTLAALDGHRERAELTIRVVEPDESAALNRQYRGIDRPTNVLSFPFALPPGLNLDDNPADDSIRDLLGDLVICADVVQREALEQGKELSAHWAHMVLHGVLHLLDYDHLDESEAEIMETLETKLLGALGFPPPYADLPDADPQDQPRR